MFVFINSSDYGVFVFYLIFIFKLKYWRWKKIIIKKMKNLRKAI
jgi:hypothetical protein